MVSSEARERVMQYLPAPDVTALSADLRFRPFGVRAVDGAAVATGSLTSHRNFH
jgi:hypothetical protein